MQSEHTYYSVRMRAAKGDSHKNGGKHISGGEVIATFSELESSIARLVEKGLTHSRGKPEFMNVEFEKIEQSVEHVAPLAVHTNSVTTIERGQATARSLLTEAGVHHNVINKSYQVLSQISELRGAVLIDVHTGQRLDDPAKNGVRVSRMDWPWNNFESWAKTYHLPQNNRMKEALVLATKVIHHPATTAELCWSDDPDYITGYVANRALGYQRITQLKELGDEKGCRIFYVDPTKVENLDAYINYLTRQPVFIHWEKEQVINDESRSFPGTTAN
ncbi:6-carboxyhexanoate--CoA ligase [Alkalihalophilus lindianensis]|uniref:6-carboxyhexanoate--CoA ligase n=1 Tax=Alkalihalophilus lindianensis TaxID=1630542 RepID=A0ABU3X6P9_9BACI|nr:6-carboxyhexanoate--CoA ligase [Alkalihalophilus lindianensis]MDV2683587.1 6-carboxyhexanoate--CoA ligase [Alkalihalophilus lindianensis]